ncbi:MAG: bifunctional hydroxymethylpyrimidine kinase/phosphomethylpyrimidine kinase, partial [Candidatus Brockarchaeota archaeon]|nr:bifunctional hydroxymethylpyrimidine kinase/phosphomethylpyrimidine kinase [Candidatus Brockarchaeota archaeon]
MGTPIALTIAGSDSSGGAGIQADLKTFAALGVYGASVIVAITAQNTQRVKRVYEVSSEAIEEQIKAILEDFEVGAIKTGMLHNTEIVSTVARILKDFKHPLVVDPVILAKDGTQLLKEEAIKTTIKELFPIATIVTPNKHEAEKLTEISIKNIEDMKLAAKKIVESYGAKAVVVKGGHLNGNEAVDVIYYEGKYKELKTSKIITKNTHGTGCIFSAAIAAELAKGEDIQKAVEVAKLFVTQAIAYSLAIGKGQGPTNPTSWLQLPAEKYNVLENMKKAIEILEENREVANLVPEVQMNLVMSLPKPYAKDIEHIAGIPGRIVKVGNKVKASSQPSFGASWHMARALLKVMEFDENFRAAMNIKYSKSIEDVIRSVGFSVISYERSEEPLELRKKEGESIPWLVERAIKKSGKVPDAVCDLGDWGKEPLIYVFGKDAVEVANKVVR